MNPLIFLSYALLAIAAGLVGFITKTELFEPDGILNGYYNWLSRMVGPEARLHKRKPRQWLYKPLGYCLQCFTGQLALWAYLASLARPAMLRAGLAQAVLAWLAQIHPGHLVFTICGAIFVARYLSLRLK